MHIVFLLLCSLIKLDCDTSLSAPHSSAVLSLWPFPQRALCLSLFCSSVTGQHCVSNRNLMNIFLDAVFSSFSICFSLFSVPHFLPVTEETSDRLLCALLFPTGDVACAEMWLAAAASPDLDPLQSILVTIEVCVWRAMHMLVFLLHSSSDVWLFTGMNWSSCCSPMDQRWIVKVYR